MRHYKVDRSKIPQRDRRAEAESSREMGWFQMPVYEVVPISSIIPERVWKDIKLQKNLAAMQAGRPLAPITVAQKGRKFSITDGIHRYNASLEMGYTHIPIVKYVTVETPELYEAPDAEKPILKPRTFVKLKDPAKWQAVSPWAMVQSYIGPATWKGAKRHKYELIGFDQWSDGEADFLGDIMDEFFDPGRPPREEADALREYADMMRVARKVASIYLS